MSTTSTEIMSVGLAKLSPEVNDDMQAKWVLSVKGSCAFRADKRFWNILCDCSTMLRLRGMFIPGRQNLWAN